MAGPDSNVQEQLCWTKGWQSRSIVCTCVCVWDTKISHKQARGRSKQASCSTTHRAGSSLSAAFTREQRNHKLSPARWSLMKLFTGQFYRLFRFPPTHTVMFFSPTQLHSILAAAFHKQSCHFTHRLQWLTKGFSLLLAVFFSKNNPSPTKSFSLTRMLPTCHLYLSKYIKDQTLISIQNEMTTWANASHVVKT